MNINNIPTPALIVDKAIFDRNAKNKNFRLPQVQQSEAEIFSLSSVVLVLILVVALLVLAVLVVAVLVRVLVVLILVAILLIVVLVVVLVLILVVVHNNSPCGKICALRRPH